MPECPPAYKYFAFISYSHADEKWGEWLHRGIETYRLPKGLAGRDGTRSGDPVPARLFPVFRDREELPTSADLGTMLREALDGSRYLVVICTPRAANSKWVNEEVLHFKRSGRANRVLCLIADGEPNAAAGEKPEMDSELECFPPAVRHPVDAEGNLDFTRSVEPIAADARTQGDGKRGALLKLIAGLAEVGLDELRQREHERARTMMLRWLVASAALVLVFAGLATVALDQRSRALAEEKRAQQTLSGSDFAQADELMRRGEPNAALLHLSRAVTTDPDNTAAQLRMASLLKQRSWPYEMQEPTGSAEGGVRGVMPVPGGDQVVVQRSEGFQQIWQVPGAAVSPPLLHDEVEWAGRLSFLAVMEPTGKRMASGGHDGKVRLWQLPGGGKASSPRDLGSQVTALTADVKGRGLAAGSDKGRVVWMDWDGHSEQLADDSGGRVTAIAIRADGMSLAAAIGDGVVKVWTLENSNQPLEIKHPKTVNGLALSPDGRWLVTGCHDGGLRIWDTSSGRPQQEQKMDAAVGGITFSPSGQVLAAGWGYYEDPWRVTLFAMAEDGTLTPLHTVAHPLRDVGHRIGSSGFGGQSFAPDETHLLTWHGMDREVRCWSVTDGRLEVEPLLHSAPLGGAAFRGNDEILTGAADGLVRVWRWSVPLAVETKALPSGYWIKGRWLESRDAWVGYARGDHDEGLLVTAKLQDGKWAHRSFTLPDLGAAFALTADGDSALLGLLGGGLVRVDLTNGTVLKVPGWDKVKAEFVETLDQTRFLVFTSEGRLLRGNDTEAAPEEVFELGEKPRFMQLDPSRKWVVVGLDSDVAWWMPVEALAAGRRLPGHAEIMSASAFSANGAAFATADYAGHVQAWTVEAEPKFLFKGRQDAEVTALAFNAAGTILASGGRDDRVNCWAATRNGELLSSMKVPSWVESLEFGADQRQLLVATLGGRVGILDSWTGRWLMDMVSMKEDVVTCGWTRGGIWGVQREGIIHQWSFRPESADGVPVLGAILSRLRFTPGGGIQREACGSSLLQEAKARGVSESTLKWWLGRSLAEP